MAWPNHVAKAYQNADKKTKEVLINIASKSNWGEVHFINDSQSKRPVTRSLPIASECQYFGKLLDRTSCGLETYSCKKHGVCSWQPEAGVKTCEACSHYFATWRKPVTFSEHTLFPKRGNKRYNASMIPWKDGYILVYRAQWGGADIELVTLDKEYQPTMKEPISLRLATNEALAGREDARLFLLRGVPHVWYTGWQAEYATEGRVSTVHYASLDPVTLQATARYYPDIPWRREWEKNHAYFDRGGELYSVYTIEPNHVVMKVNGNKITEHWSTHSPALTDRRYGMLRGGASPMLHNGEFYTFYHMMTEAHGQRLYSIGVYTFATDPPFRITRITKQPIDVADVNGKQLIDVLFPASAFVEGREWVVTMGVHDDYSQVRYYPIDYIERHLTEV